MPDTHDHAILALRGDLEHGRKLLRYSVKRMIAAYAEFLRQTLKHPHAAIPYHRRLAMHGISQHAQFAAESLYHALQSQAHAEHRNFAFGGVANQFRHSEIGGTPRSWR